MQNRAAPRRAQTSGRVTPGQPGVAPALGTAPTLPGMAILPLRLFLGLTFLYAGVQKFTDPGFFSPGAPTYIGSQILAYSRGSPIQVFLHHTMEFAIVVGVLTIGTEMAIGLLVLLGLFTRAAALIGLVLNLVFFLSASWHTYPYFMGSDIVFVMCWLTLALTGPGPFALDPSVRQPLGERLEGYFGRMPGRALQLLLSGPLPAGDEREEAPARAATHPALSRGEALLAGAATLVLVALGVTRQNSTAGKTPIVPGAAATSPGGQQNGASGSTAQGTKIGNVSQLPANSAGLINDPKTGDPAIIIHASGSQFYAYDAVCTHAGCTVQYDPQQRMIVCPCHGATYDPTRGAEVVAGPAPTPLAKLPMTIDSKGNIYLD